MTRPKLKLDWCSHAAAVFATKHWHYSRTMVASKTLRLGVWEGGVFIGAVMFSHGASPHLGAKYGLTLHECCELTRVALSIHRTPVSRIVAIALRMLKKHSPGLRLVVSFADPAHGHHGGIYQAGGWIYAGVTSKAKAWRYKGKTLHIRSFSGTNFGNPAMPLPAGAVPIEVPGKHRYLMPLDNEMREQLRELAQPYPKRPASEAQEAVRPPHQAGGDGSTPIPTLHDE